MLRKPEISSGRVGLWVVCAFTLPHTIEDSMSEVLSFCDRERITVPHLFSEKPEVNSTMKLSGVFICRPRIAVLVLESKGLYSQSRYGEILLPSKMK